jgi:hypothetical protein
MIMAPEFHAAPKSFEIKLLDPENIRVDAVTYQFRHNGDTCGITRSGIYNTERWDPLLHGDPILAHERLDGSVFVADGHHRLDLAKRSNAIGQGPGKIAAIVLREADGYTPEDVRVIAAYRNMAKGRFEPVEGAWVLKEAYSGRIHQEWLPQLPMNTDKLQLSYTLSGLSDNALKRVEKDHIPAEMAAYVVNQVPNDTTRQEHIIGILSDQLNPQPYEQRMPEYRGACMSCQEKAGFAARINQQRQSVAALSR